MPGLEPSNPKPPNITSCVLKPKALNAKPWQVGATLRTKSFKPKLSSPKPLKPQGLAPSTPPKPVDPTLFPNIQF